MKLPRFVQIDRLLMQRGQRRRKRHFRNHVRLARNIDHHEVVARHRPQTHGIGRIAVLRPMPRARRVMQETALFQKLAQLRRYRAARISRRRACGSSNAAHFKWLDQNFQIVRIDVARVPATGRRKNPDAPRCIDRAARSKPPAPPPMSSAAAPRVPPAASSMRSCPDIPPSPPRPATRYRSPTRAHWSPPPRESRRRAAPARSRAARAADSRRDIRARSPGSRTAFARVLQIRDQDFRRQPAVSEHQRLQIALDELQRDAAATRCM